MQCDGNGYCLSVRNLICAYECEHVECPNFYLCNSKCPQFILDFNQGVCNECFVAFGNTVENPTPSNPILHRVEASDTECPICLRVHPDGGFLNPRCTHFLCVDCIRELYMKEEDAPPFPVHEQEELYHHDPALFLNDVRIREWKKVAGSWKFRLLLYRLEHRPYLKHCPICRA